MSSTLFLSTSLDLVPFPNLSREYLEDVKILVGKQTSWISLDEICKPKEEGGLGIRDLWKLLSALNFVGTKKPTRVSGQD
ncbi:unnamed protein product [Cuscuta campestris]|uniref:Uncharacterized protein n=1 Tax=Cuscuta campestris TaxID=132261 RepID=A0A484L8R3_9ASTE|nr:unnamed protein product [Cuscuta campestris]